MIFVRAHQNGQPVMYDIGNEQIMKPLTVVVGVDQSGGFGKAGKIPWYFPEDLKRFKEITKGGICIMGRKTYEDMLEMVKSRQKKKKVLKQVLAGRDCIVLTRQEGYEAEGATVANSLFNALASIEEDDEREVFVIGGEKIYIESLPWVTKIYMTLVQDNYDCDRFFPIYYVNQKFKIETGTEGKDEKLQFVEYKRIKK